jgi:hypothetical protein
LIACEEAARDETVSPREALRLIQILHDHHEKLHAAAKPGSLATKSEKIHSSTQERAS